MNRPEPPTTQRKRWWPLVKRLLTVAFFILLIVLLVMLGKNVDWDEVLSTLRDYRASTLLLAAAACLASYLAYSSFDLLGRAYAKHHLPAWQIMPVTFVCYAFNLNLSAWVGGLALRYRLYARLGLSNAEITKVYSLSLMTNWLGYLMLGGVLFAFGPIELPDSWAIGRGTLRLLGLALLAVTIVYLLLCGFSRRRSWHVRGHEIRLPSLWLASTQMALGAINWALMGLVIYILLMNRVSYAEVLGVLLISSIAGVITHVPAGLGVLEAVFVTLLQHQISKGSLLAGLIGYRALYFLAPLLVATLVYLVLEFRAKRLRQMNRDKRTTEKPPTNPERPAPKRSMAKPPLP